MGMRVKKWGKIRKQSRERIALNVAPRLPAVHSIRRAWTGLLTVSDLPKNVPKLDPLHATKTPISKHLLISENSIALWTINRRVTETNIPCLNNCHWRRETFFQPLLSIGKLQQCSAHAKWFQNQQLHVQIIKSDDALMSQTYACTCNSPIAAHRVISSDGNIHSSFRLALEHEAM